MCQECRHNPCVSGCPNFEPRVAYYCNCCGGKIYVGDIVYVADDKYYCEDCCYTTEAELPEPDDDDSIYENWRDRKREQEHDV